MTKKKHILISLALLLFTLIFYFVSPIVLSFSDYLESVTGFPFTIISILLSVFLLILIWIVSAILGIKYDIDYVYSPRMYWILIFPIILLSIVFLIFKF